MILILDKSTEAVSSYLFVSSGCLIGSSVGQLDILNGLCDLYFVSIKSRAWSSMPVNHASLGDAFDIVKCFPLNSETDEFALLVSRTSSGWTSLPIINAMHHSEASVV